MEKVTEKRKKKNDNKKKIWKTPISSVNPQKTHTFFFLVFSRYSIFTTRRWYEEASSMSTPTLWFSKFKNKNKINFFFSILVSLLKPFCFYKKKNYVVLSCRHLLTHTLMMVLLNAVLEKSNPMYVAVGFELPLSLPSSADFGDRCKEKEIMKPEPIQW